MQKNNFTPVEKQFFEASGYQETSTRIPYVVVDNFPKLGFLTALRFLEWVTQNPEGVISLPTGKTPEYFINYTKYFLQNWDSKESKKLLNPYGLADLQKPEMRGLQFVQIDEFYPICSSQHNSFHNYVKKYYVEGFGLDPDKGLFISSDEIQLANAMHFSEVFPDNTIDLSLRYREPKNKTEQIQQTSIMMIDNWCSEYENNIREKGGIGFFLGGIGPDGHIAFNIRGSDHHSTTRLTSTNFETQAVAAGDLGGMEVSRNRLVITIGLETITYNPDAVAIIFAAGEAKANVVKNALEQVPDNLYPATVLQSLPNSRFYLTRGATANLNDSLDKYYLEGDWTQEKTERAVIDLCSKIDKYGFRITMDDLQNDPYCRLIPGLNEETVREVTNAIKQKIALGIRRHSHQTFYHTGPHHDDIMLGIMPDINRQLRDTTNTFHFTVLTSGFTSVTNAFMINLLVYLKHFLELGRIEMTRYPDFFESGYLYKWEKDVYSYLNNIAANDPEELNRNVSHRLTRIILSIWKVKNEYELRDTINGVLFELRQTYQGAKDSPKIQRMKGMIREFEEELVWAHYGVKVNHVHHLRLGFYKGDIFTERPNRDRDVKPILEQLRAIKPSIISIALDPEGSGPDTHYKVLQAMAQAVKEWSKEEDLSKLKIIGYRNVWYKFHPAEADVIVPVTLNGLSILNESFSRCYLSQVNASFPSYELDGQFPQLTQKIWVGQLKKLQLLLGKNFFYLNQDPLLRATHGMLFYKELQVEDFLKVAWDLEASMEGLIS